MRGLAEYAMLGRRQAIIIVLLCGFFPMFYFVSASMVGLVNLRKSFTEGLVILLWSMLPAGLLWALGDSLPLVLMVSIAALSQVLKRYDSWQLVILICAVLGIFIQISLNWQTGYVEQMEAMASEVIALQQNQGTDFPYTAEQFVELGLSFYGASHVMIILLCLMLARWWQATLYNKGGFQQEFHQLRFDSKMMLPVFGLILVGMAGIEPFSSWLIILCIPPTIGGIALMHYIVAYKKMGAIWLALCYLTVIMVAPVIILLGMSDSGMDLRKRIK